MDMLCLKIHRVFQAMTVTIVTPTYLPALSLHLPLIDTRNLGPQYLDQDYVRRFIAKQFKHKQIGKVSRIDLFLKTNRQGHYYYEAFVHFQKWFASVDSLALRRAVCSGQRATLRLLKSRRYWLVNESQSPVFEEDWQSILTVIPGARWVQAGDEEELIEYMERTKAAKTIQKMVRERHDDICPAVRALFAAYDRRQQELEAEKLTAEEMAAALGTVEQR